MNDETKAVFPWLEAFLAHVTIEPDTEYRMAIPCWVNVSVRSRQELIDVILALYEGIDRLDLLTELDKSFCGLMVNTSDGSAGPRPGIEEEQPLECA